MAAPTRNPFDEMNLRERVDLAKLRMNRVVDHIQNLIALRENNEVILYSRLLVDQIPKSHAAKAFNSFRDAVFRFEIVRLCALWDRAGTDRESLPTVSALVADRRVVRELAMESYRSYASV